MTQRSSLLLVCAAAFLVPSSSPVSAANPAIPTASRPIRSMIEALGSTVGLTLPTAVDALVNLYVRGSSPGQMSFEGWDPELTKDLTPRDLARIYMSNALQDAGDQKPTDSKETFGQIAGILEFAYHFPHIDPSYSKPIYLPSQVNFAFTNVEVFGHPGGILFRYKTLTVVDLSDPETDVGPISNLPHQYQFGFGPIEAIVIYPQRMNDDQLEDFLVSIEQKIGRSRLISGDVKSGSFRAFGDQLNCEKSEQSVQGQLAVIRSWSCAYKVQLNTLR